MIDIYIDGACLGNPGRIGAGYLIFKQGRLIAQDSVFLGTGTNNFAEYMGCILALTRALSLGAEEINLYSDSNLLCQQLNGNFKVKSSNIYPLFVLANKLVADFKKIKISHIAREKNKEADRLAKKAVSLN